MSSKTFLDLKINNLHTKDTTKQNGEKLTKYVQIHKRSLPTQSSTTKKQHFYLQSHNLIKDHTHLLYIMIFMYMWSWKVHHKPPQSFPQILIRFHSISNLLRTVFSQPFCIPCDLKRDMEEGGKRGPLVYLSNICTCNVTFDSNKPSKK